MAPDLADAGDLAEPSPWRDLRRRSLTAFVLAPVVLLCLWWGGIAWAVLVGLVAIGLGYEWAQLCKGTGGRGSAPPSFLLLLGLAYIAPSVLALLWLRAGGGIDMLLVLLVVWATDIGAYLAGRWFGGPRLAPSISPGKTWSGAIGGIAGAALVGVGMISWLGHAIGGTLAIVLFMLVCVLLSVVAQAGDLMESAVKSDNLASRIPAGWCRAMAACSTGSTGSWPRPRWPPHWRWRSDVG